MAATARRQANRRIASPGIPRWLLLGVLVLMVLAGIAIARLSRGESNPTGSLGASHLAHDFGQVGIGEGVLATRFPLDLRGTVRVTTLESS